MPVEFRKGKGKPVATLRCDVEGCDAVFGPVTTRTAAPELDACEEAAKKGWSYSVGFWAMLAGPQTVCPKHAKERSRAMRQKAKESPDGQ